mgnify:CR=1 FL=1
MSKIDIWIVYHPSGKYGGIVFGEYKTKEEVHKKYPDIGMRDLAMAKIRKDEKEFKGNGCCYQFSWNNWKRKG